MTPKVVASYAHTEKNIGGTLWIEVARHEVTLSFQPWELYGLAACLRNRSGLPLPQIPEQAMQIGRIRAELERFNSVPLVRIFCGSSMCLLVSEVELSTLIVYWLERYAPAKVRQLLQAGVA